MKAATAGTDEILKDIAGAKTETLEMLYKNCYPPVKTYVISNSGNYADAEDVFQDAVTIVFRRARQGDLQLYPHTAISTLINGIARNLWLRKLAYRKMEKVSLRILEGEITLPQSIEDEINSLELGRLWICQKYFMQMHERCRILLRLFMKGMQMKEIAEIMDFDSEDQAKTAKFRCKKKLALAILNDKEYQSMF